MKTLIILLFATTLTIAARAQIASTQAQICDNIYAQDQNACKAASQVMLGPNGADQPGRTYYVTQCTGQAKYRHDNFCMKGVPIAQWPKMDTPYGAPGPGTSVASNPNPSDFPATVNSTDPHYYDAHATYPVLNGSYWIGVVPTGEVSVGEVKVIE